jgi:type II secretion system protein N
MASLCLVNRFSKVILSSALAGGILAGGALVGAKFYAQSDAGRARLETELAKALKLPVRLGAVEAGFLGQLQARGVTMPAPTEGEPPLAQASAVRANIRLAALFGGRFAIDGLVLEQPVLTWPQNADGRWVWPSTKSKTTAPEKTATPAAPKEKPAVQKPDEPVLTSLQARGATIHLLDQKRRPIVTAEKTDIDLTELGRGPVAGKALIGRLTWKEYPFDNVSTTFRYAEKALTLDELSGGLFGGQVQGSFTLEPEAKNAPFKLRVEVTKVDLNTLATAAGWQDGEVAGKLSGQLTTEGSAKEFIRMKGPGSLSVETGRFKRIEMFESIAHVLEIPELTNLQPNEAVAKFNLRDAKAYVDEIAIGTDNLRITAKGEARFDDEKLKLDARLAITDRLAKTMQEFAVNNFAKQPDGWHALDFKISGKLTKPKTDLSEKLIGGKVKDKVEDLLGGLFGTKPKEKDNKEKADKAKPAAQ